MEKSVELENFSRLVAGRPILRAAKGGRAQTSTRFAREAVPK